MNEIIFTNNSAIYGNDIASYAVSIKPTNSTTNSFSYLTNIPSGQVYDQNILVGLYDYDDQIMNRDFTSKIFISSMNSSASINIILNKIVRNGVADFKGIQFNAIPGVPNYYFELTSSAIDKDKYFRVYGSNYTSTHMIVNFRN
jgi:hypothetical protein